MNADPTPYTASDPGVPGVTDDLQQRVEREQQAIRQAS